MKAKEIPCIVCGGLPEVYGSDHINDHGPYFAACKQCGEETAAWAYAREAWKHWRDMNTIKKGE